jgi:hypothetical protein
VSIKSAVVSEAAGVLASIPRRCHVFGTTARFRPTRFGTWRVIGVDIETRCLLNRYHTGPCSFSILGVGREDV